MDSPSDVPLPPSPTPTLTVDDVLNFNVDDLREQLDLRGVSTTGMTKPALQKALLSEIQTTTTEVGDAYFSSAVDPEWRKEELALEMQDRREAREALERLEVRKLEAEKDKQEALERLEVKKLEAEKETRQAEKRRVKHVIDRRKERENWIQCCIKTHCKRRCIKQRKLETWRELS